MFFYRTMWYIISQNFNILRCLVLEIPWLMVSFCQIVVLISIIAAPCHECQGLSNHHQLDCLFSNLPNCSGWQKTLSKLRIVGLLCMAGIDRRTVVPLHMTSHAEAHDDVIKWKHFPLYWSFVWGIHWSRVNSRHKGKWCGALMFSLICVWIKGWVNKHEAGDLRRFRAHYDVIVMVFMEYPLMCPINTS